MQVLWKPGYIVEDDGTWRKPANRDEQRVASLLSLTVSLNQHRAELAMSKPPKTVNCRCRLPPNR